MKKQSGEKGSSGAADRRTLLSGRFARAFVSGMGGLGFGAAIGLGLSYLVTRYSGIVDPDMVKSGHDVIIFWGIVAAIAIPVFIFQFYRSWRGL